VYQTNKLLLHLLRVSSMGPTRLRFLVGKPCFFSVPDICLLDFVLCGLLAMFAFFRNVRSSGIAVSFFERRSLFVVLRVVGGGVFIGSRFWAHNGNCYGPPSWEVDGYPSFEVIVEGS